MGARHDPATTMEPGHQQLPIKGERYAQGPHPTALQKGHHSPAEGSSSPALRKGPHSPAKGSNFLNFVNNNHNKHNYHINNNRQS